MPSLVSVDPSSDRKPRAGDQDQQQGQRRFTTAADADAAMNELVKAGCGKWEPTPSGRRGQPTREFVLNSTPPVYGNTPNPEENGNTVDGVDDQNFTDRLPDGNEDYDWLDDAFPPE